MSDLDEILELIASFFAVVVLLLIIMTWLEATMSEDYVPWVRHPRFRDCGRPRLRTRTLLPVTEIAG